MSFQEQKSRQLSREDKSGKGNWDRAISSLCKKINSRKEYYTTSSCSGRAILIKALDEKTENVFLFKSHEKISFSQLKEELGKIRYRKLIYFKQEPCILHVACSSLVTGKILLNKARFAGWKRSGMIAEGKRVILELMSTEKLELPVMNNRKLLIDDDFLRLLVEEANKKLERTWEKIRKLEKLV